MNHTYTNSGNFASNASAVESDIFNIKEIRARKSNKTRSSKQKNRNFKDFCDSESNFEPYVSKCVEFVPCVYTVEQKMEYFDMLARNKAAKKARKYMRRAMRQVENMSYDDVFLDITVEGDFEPDIKADSESIMQKAGIDWSIEGLQKTFDDILTKLLPFHDKILDKVKNTGLFKYLTAHMPAQKDLYWLAYASLFMVQLYRSQSIKDDLICLGQFCVVSGMIEKKSDIISSVIPILWTLRVFYRSYASNEEGEEDKIIVEGSLSQFIFDTRSNTADFITSHFVKSVSSIIMILATYHFFPQNVAKHIRAWIGRIDRPKNIPEAISRITTDVGNLVQMAEKVLIDGTPVSKVFLEADPILAAKAEANRLLLEGNALYFGLPQPNKFDAITWVSQAQEITKVIMNMQKKLSPYEVRAEGLRSVCISLLAKLEEVIGRTRACKRPTPYFVIIPGLPGIGKSSLVTLIFQAWARVKGRDFNQRHVFERVALSEYWDGYSAEGTPYIHMSELGALKDEMVKLGQDKSAIELTSIVDSLPYSLNMSKTTEKGSNFCMPEIVIADTNNENLNLNVMVRNLAAFKRRGVYIHATVKEANRKDGSIALDANKKIEGQDDMDKWTFKVMRHDPVDLTKSISRDLMSQLPVDSEKNIYDLMAVLTKDMEDHIERESKVNDMFKENWVMKNSELIANIRAKYNMIEGSVFKSDIKVDSVPEIKDDSDDKDAKCDDCDDFNNIDVTVHHDEPVKIDIPNENVQFLLDNGVLVDYNPLSSRFNLVRGVELCKRTIENLDEKNDQFFNDVKEILREGTSFIINNRHFFASYWFLKMGKSDLLRKEENKIVQVEASIPEDDLSRKKKAIDRMLQDLAQRRAMRSLNNEIVVGVNPDRDIALNQNVSFCKCCAHGVHVPNAREKFVTHIKLGATLMKRVVFDCLNLFAFCVVNFHSIFTSSSDLVQIMSVLLLIAFVLLIPYGFFIVILLASINLVSLSIDYIKKGSITVQQDLHQRVDVLTTKVTTHIDDFVGYIKRKQTLAVRITVGVAVITTVVLALGGMATLLWPRKKKDFVVVESSVFRGKTKNLERLTRHEMNLKMSDPKVRIKSANEKIKVYSNVITTVAPPRCTTGTLLEFKELIYRNVRPFQVVTSTYKRHGYALGIKGIFALINKHYIDFSLPLIELQFAFNMNAIEEKGDYVYAISKKYCPRDFISLDDDLLLIELPSSISTRDILAHIPNDYLIMNKNKVMVADEESYANDCNPVYADDALLKKKFVQQRVASYEWTQHVPGMCGLPVVCEVQGGYFVAGVHSSAHTNTSQCYLIKLSSSVLNDLIKINVEGNFTLLSDISDNFAIAGEEPSGRSFTRFIDQGPVQIYGQVHHFSGNQKSNISLSIFGRRENFLGEMFEHLPEHEIVSFRPAMMGPRKNEYGVFGNPTTVGAIKLCQKRTPLNPISIKKARDVLLKKIISNLEEIGVARDYKPVDIQTVINGHVSDYLARPVDKTKSAGFGYPGKKKDHLVGYPDDEKIMNVIYEPNDTLAGDVSDIIDSYLRGESTGPIFTAALKDEVRSREKYNAFKTRIFYGTPFPFLIIQKAFMSPLYTLMIEHGEAFYAGLGVDMHRTGHLIKKRLGDFCKDRMSDINCIEGDYGSFDTGMPYEIGEASCHISYELLKWLGYTQSQLDVVNGILTDLLRPRVDFFGDLILVPGLQPSGKYATAEDNSIRNLLILMYIWYDNPETKDKDFFEYVLPCVYGDDVVASVTDAVKNSYNNIVINQGCSRMGLDFTTSDKGVVTNPFIDFGKISFLKRTFQYHDKLEREAACLAPSSLMKTLQYVEASKCVSLESQMESICLSTLTEYFFWTPSEEKFNSFRQYLLDVLRENFPNTSFGFPLFGDFVARYKEDPFDESL